MVATPDTTTARRRTRLRLARALPAAALASGLMVLALPGGVTGAGAATAQAQVAPHAAAPVVAHAVVAPRATSSAAAFRRAIGPMRAAPHATGAAATFTVNSLADSPLANSSGKTCVDSETSHHCSLRAAVQAAGNLDKPVVIKLGAHTYSLTDSGLGALDASDAGGITFDGVSEAATKIAVPESNDYGVMEVTYAPGDLRSIVFLSNLTLTGGDADYGGGLDLADGEGSAVLDSVSITGNTSSDDGGGIYAYVDNLWLTNSTVSGNTSDGDGGGIYEYFSNLQLTNTKVNADTADDDGGGGTFSEYGNVRIIGGSVSNDTAGSVSEAGYGGGLYDYYAGTTLVGTAVDSDTANDGGYGGGDFESWSSLNATGATFSSDRAIGSDDAAGGGIASEETSEITLQSVTMSHDSTTSTADYYGGGAVWDEDYKYSASFQVSGSSSFTDNGTGAIVLDAYYGGLASDIDGATFKGNTSSLEYSGAAVTEYSDYYASMSLNMTGDKILDNTEIGEEGAGGVVVYNEEYGGASLDMTGSTVDGNVARGEDGTGGIKGYSDYYGGVELEIDGSTLSGNSAPDEGYGGAVYLYNDYSEDTDASAILDGDTITHNTAGSAGTDDEGYGGGVFTEYYTALKIAHSTIADNTAVGNGSDGGYGGGVYDLSYGGTSYVDDTISGNHATGYESEGGGLYVYPYYGDALLSASTVSSNSAEAGGGVYVGEDQMDIESSTISDNSAVPAGGAGYGAGIYEDETSIEINNSTISGNEALNATTVHGDGGGIYSYDAVAEMYFTTIAGNSATQGAGIYNDDTSGLLRDSIVVDNNTTAHSKTPADCYDSLAEYASISGGGNVLSHAAGCLEVMGIGDLVTSKTVVAPLAANGGPTKTMALVVGSPAIDAAHGDCPAVDQRGVARPKTGVCDSGAYQLVVVKKK